MHGRDLAYAAGQAEGEMEDLPVVNDLEVAAAAAAAAMGESNDETESDESSDDSSATEAESSDDDSEPSDHDELGVGNQGAQRISVQLQFQGDRVALTLDPAYSLASRGFSADDEILMATTSEEHEYEPDEDSDMSSSDEEEMITDYNQLRQIIDTMDDDEDMGGGAGGPPASLASELFGELPLPLLTDITITADDALVPAGTIMSTMEGMIVVRAASGSRALDDGTILVLEDRQTILGAVEEVFGPINAPLYALRYIGGDGAPATFPVNTPVFSVERLSSYILPDELRVKGYDGDVGEEAEDAEQQFSDDEAEAEYKRKLKAKRKGAAAAGGDASSDPSKHQSGPTHRAPKGRRGGRGGRGGGLRQHGGGYFPPQQQYMMQQQQQQQHMHMPPYGMTPMNIHAMQHHQMQMQQQYAMQQNGMGMPQQGQGMYGGFRMAQPGDFHPAVPPPPPQQQQQQQQGGGPQRVFGGLGGGKGPQQAQQGPTAKMQTYATAGQLSGTSLQQGEQQEGQP